MAAEGDARQARVVHQRTGGEVEVFLGRGDEHHPAEATQGMLVAQPAVRLVAGCAIKTREHLDGAALVRLDLGDGIDDAANEQVALAIDGGEDQAEAMQMGWPVGDEQAVASAADHQPGLFEPAHGVEHGGTGDLVLLQFVVVRQLGAWRQAAVQDGGGQDGLDEVLFAHICPC